MFIAPERLYLTADRSRAVSEDSPEAAILLVAQGGAIPDAEAERYGLTTEKPSEGDSEQEVATEAKAIEAPPENKAVQFPPANKRRGKAK